MVQYFSLILSPHNYEYRRRPNLAPVVPMMVIFADHPPPKHAPVLLHAELQQFSHHAISLKPCPARCPYVSTPHMTSVDLNPDEFNIHLDDLLTPYFFSATWLGLVERDSRISCKLR